MGLELLHGIKQDSIVRVRNHHAGAIVASDEAHGFEDLEATVDLCNPLLHGCVLEIHLTEFLIAWVALDILDEGETCFEASLSHTWGTNLRIKGLYSFDAIFDKLSWGLLLLSFLSLCCGGRSAKPLTTITLQ